MGPLHLMTKQYIDSPLFHSTPELHYLLVAAAGAADGMVLVSSREM